MINDFLKKSWVPWKFATVSMGTNIATQDNSFYWMSAAQWQDFCGVPLCPFCCSSFSKNGVMEALSFQSFIFFFTRGNKVYLDVDVFSMSQVSRRGRGRIWTMLEHLVLCVSDNMCFIYQISQDQSLNPDSSAPFPLCQVWSQALGNTWGW